MAPSCVNCRAIIPIMQGYEDSGDFTVRERLRTSIRGNLILIGVVGSVAITGVIILLATKRMAWCVAQLSSSRKQDLHFLATEPCISRSASAARTPELHVLQTRLRCGAGSVIPALLCNRSAMGCVVLWCRDTIVKMAIGASNAFALVTGALLLGFGLVEIPRGLWRHADLAERQRWLSHRVAKTAQKLDQAHQELSTAIVVSAPRRTSYLL